MNILPQFREKGKKQTWDKMPCHGQRPNLATWFMDLGSVRPLREWDKVARVQPIQAGNFTRK